MIKLKVLFAQMEDVDLADYEHKAHDSGNSLRYDCGKGRSCNSHVKRNDEQKVQQDIDYRCDDEELHRVLAARA